MTVSMSLFYIYQYESTYDRDFPDSQNIYRVMSVDDRTGKEMYSATSPEPLIAQIKDNVSGVKSITRMSWMWVHLQKDDESVRLRATLAADTNYFDVFEPRILDGVGKSSLDLPNSLIISESYALEHFGTTDGLIGTNVKLKARWITRDMTITAIMEDAPVHSSIRPRYIVSLQFHKDNMEAYSKKSNYTPRPWNNSIYHLYVKFIDEAPVHTFQTQVDLALKKLEDNTFIKQYFLQPIHDIYLHSPTNMNSLHREGNATNNLIFLITGFVILFISIVNLIVLTIAQANYRVTEFGIRKSQGASQSNLRIQIAIESIIVVTLCGLLSIGITRMVLPEITELLDVNVPISEFFSTKMILRLIAIVVIVASAVGSYSGIYLSGLPTLSLQGTSRSSSNASIWVYRTLILFQLVIVVSLFQSMGAVQNQIQYMINRDMGFKSENILMLTVNIAGINKEEYPVFREAMLQSPAIIDIASFSPQLLSHHSSMQIIPDPRDPTKKFKLMMYSATPNIFSMLGLQVTEGFDGSCDRGKEGGLYLNRSAANLLFPDEDVIVGKSLYGEGYVITGMIEDFHVRSLHEEIGPFALHTSNSPYHIRSTMVETTGSPEAMKSIREVVEAYLEPSGRTFTLEVLADEMKDIYAAELRFREKLLYLVVIAIAIAGIGLFSTSYFVAARRLKDYAIMRVLGASRLRLGVEMLLEFIQIAILAAIIATPLGLKTIDIWLANFYYRAPISLSNILLAILVGMLIVVLTVSLNWFRVIRQQPVNILNEE